MVKENLFTDQLLWYKDAIIYELHIKAFFDGNNDGIGDFKGLLQKLDYLQDLGITTIWVLPFYPSPLKDDGYDIADYYNINPSYGTIQQFQQFLDEAHKRNLKVITELVINHTSDQHPWFQRARRAQKGSEERNYYVWTDNPNQYKDVRIIFQDFETSNWTWDPIAQQYYWHRFFHHQPDLNYDSLKVQDEIYKIIDYWCSMGVDGFRLDAVPYLYEREGTNGENLPETHAFLKKLRKHVDEHYPGTVFLAEANMWPEDSASYFGNGDECHMNYHFPVMPRMFMALQREDRYPITDIFDQTPEIPSNCQWAMFLRNHDELTLEMVTDEERDYMYKAYAKDPKARINLGIRHRLAPLMDNSRRKIELMNSLLFSLPGTPVIYYGDEIGMGDNYYLGDRDGVRTPMQWSPDRNAGFSDTNPQQLYLPVILDPQYHYESVNVETQRSNTSSLFWYMKRIISLRKKYKAFSRGDMRFLQVDNPKVLAFTRTYNDETILVIVNLGKYAQPAEIDLSGFKGYLPIEVFSKNKFPQIKEDPYFFTLDAHSFQWFLLQKVNTETTEKSINRIFIHQFNELIESSAKETFETLVLPDYLNSTKWFTGKGRNIYSISINNSVLVKRDHESWLLIIEVAYESGMPDQYFLPVTFVQADRAKKIAESCAQAIICPATIGENEGFICDALFINEIQQAIINRIGAKEHIKTPEGEIAFNGNESLRNYINEHPEIKPKLHADERSNTSITYDNRYFFKAFRKIEKGVHPDVEMSKFLTEEIKYSYVPEFTGTIEWKTEREALTLGMIEQMVENHGDGHSFMLERLNNFIERIVARKKELSSYNHDGTFSSPIGLEELDDEMNEFIGPSAGELSRLIGKRTGEMHLALSSGTEKDFRPEEFSLHYQRSLFSSMLSLVRETYQSLNKKKGHLPEHLHLDADMIAENRITMVNLLKRIYARKLDILKIRTHGNFHLRQILLTGRDIAIHDFGGNPARSYSERKIKRSAIRDIAGLIRSFYYTAYEGFLNSSHIQNSELINILPFADLWAHYMSGFFLKAYLETVQGSSIIPENQTDLDMLIQTFILEIALYHLDYELNNRPEWAIVPIKMIKRVLDNNLSQSVLLKEVEMEQIIDENKKPR